MALKLWCFSDRVTSTFPTKQENYGCVVLADSLYAVPLSSTAKYFVCLLYLPKVLGHTSAAGLGAQLGKYSISILAIWGE